MIAAKTVRLLTPRGSIEQGQCFNVVRFLPRGYPELVACMNTDIDFVMFRRFGYLHLRHLLYLQEELSSIEKKIYHQDLQDPEPLNLMSREYDTNEERKATMIIMIAKLKEYGKYNITFQTYTL
jgi:hypothetical protein